MASHAIDVRSDNPKVVDLLRDIAGIVRGEGAEVNPAAIIVEENGDLWVEAPRSATPTALFSMPPGVLAEVGLGTWQWLDDDLRVSTSEAADAVKADLLSAHCALYNATGKGRWFRAHHPRALLADTPEITSIVEQIKPDFTPDSSADGYLRTRVLGIRDPTKEGPSDSVLMPLIDNLNNHPDGAAFRRSQGISVNVSQPTGTRECFAMYGQRRNDTLGLALSYGYLDTARGEAMSAPVHIEVAGLGEVTVGYSAGSRISPLDPPRLQRGGTGLHLSHLTFHHNEPQRLLVPLHMMLTALGTKGNVEARAQSLATAVAIANITLLDSLESALSSTQKSGFGVLRAAVTAQRAIIRSGSGVG